MQKSRGEARENRAKVREPGLTFPVVLQQHWGISRRYAMFATPIAYLIDEAGVITRAVAVGPGGDSRPAIASVVREINRLGRRRE